MEKAAWTGVVAGFESCHKAGLGRVASGRRADREEVMIERDKVRGTERATERSDNIMNDDDGGWDGRVGQRWERRSGICERKIKAGDDDVTRQDP